MADSSGTDDLGRRRRLAVIYDTSYLMHDQFRPLNSFASATVPRRKKVQREQKLRFGVTTFDEEVVEHMSVTQFVELVEYVPVEVEYEVSKHLKDQTKVQSAARARNLIIDLRENGAVIVEAGKAESVDLGPSPIGADSDTDKKLICFGLSLLTAGFDEVLIATDDGGIRYSTLGLRQGGSQIRSWSIRDSANPLLAHVVAE